ncbi:MAG: 2-phospho-L-lactate transferase [archaeon]|nr:2-phospho-L-lactate transferase [Candidatus Bathyarchaeum sp.]
MITALAGGVGASKFLKGLVQIVPEKELTIIGNTGDDIELYGLQISPDLDIVMYTLAGIVNQTTGWGIKDDSFECLEMLKQYGLQTWFNLGNKDLATHIYRTHLLNQGFTLSAVTQKLCEHLGLKVRLLPMSDNQIATMVVTDLGTIHFEEYLIKRGTQDRVIGIEFEGIKNSKPADGVLESILSSDAVILCPSNPLVSIGPILSVPGVRDAVKTTKARKIAISPIVGGLTIKGPADKMMRGSGIEVSAYGVASLYRDFLDVFVIDTVDADQKARIESLGMDVAATNTVMKTLDDKINLAETVLAFI